MPSAAHRFARHSRRLRVLASLLGTIAVGVGVQANDVVRLAPFEVVAPPLVAAPVTDSFGGTPTRLTEAQLTTLNATDLPAALRHTPGVTISRYNVVGSFGGDAGGAVFLRGLGSSRPGGELKVYLDDVPLTNGVFNHPLLDLVSVDNAAEIEVLPRVAPLEEGNAFAAIRLTSPRLARPGFFARGTAEVGSFGTWMARVDLAENTGESEAWITASRHQSDGARPDSAGRLENELARFAWHLSDGLVFSYVVNHTDNLATDPGPAGVTSGPTNTRGETYATTDWMHLVSLEHHNQLGDGLLRAYYTTGTGDWLRRAYSGNPDSLNEWQQRGLRWRETIRLTSGTEIVTGADFDANRGGTISVPPAPDAVTGFGPTTFRLFSAYAGASQKFGLGNGLQLTPSAGARYYRHSEFGSAWAPQAALTLAAGRTQARLAFSRALNYPGLEVAALASPVAIPALGTSWQTLRPESLDQWELGVHHTFTGWLSADATLFRNEGHNRYVMVFPPPPPPHFANIEHFRTSGGELTLNVAPTKSFALFTGLSLLRADPGDLPYAPHTSVTFGANWRPATAWLFSADLQAISSMHVLSQARTAGAPNDTTVGPQRLLHARLAYTFTWVDAGRRHRAEVFVAGDNLLDRRYAYRPGYPMPGISGTTGVTITW